MGSIEITLDYMIFDELHNIKGNNDYNNFVFCNKIINKSLTVEVLLKRYIINNEKKKKKLVFMKYFSYLNEILKENLKSYNKTVKNQNEFEKDEKILSLTYANMIIKNQHRKKKTYILTIFIILYIVFEINYFISAISKSKNQLIFILN